MRDEFMLKRKPLLSLLLATVLLTGCGGGTVDDEASPTPAEEGTAETISAAETEITRATTPDSLPEDLDFGGKTVTILHRAGDRDVQVEVWAEDTGDVVESSICNRNIAIEDRLNISFAYATTADEIHTGTEVNTLLRASVLAGDAAYDIAANHMSQTTPLILDNHFYNLNTLPYLDFSMPWWNASFNEQITLQNKLYFAVGDLSQTMLRGTYVTFCNGKLLNEYYGDYDIYETVRSGDWTIDEFRRLADMYHDVNGDGQADHDDVYGCVRDTAGLINDALVGSFQIPLVAHGDSGEPKIVLESEKTIRFIEIMQNLLFEDNYCWSEDYTTLTEKFVDDTAMLCIYRLSLSEIMRDMESDYSIIPCPKMDAEQEDYTCFTHNGFSVFVIPLSAADAEMSAAVLEALSAESYRSCTMAYYETTVKEKLARDTNVAEMIDLIYDGIIFDFGYVYAGSLNDLIQVFRTSINNTKSTTGASTLAKKVTQATDSLKKILEAYDTLE